MTDAIDTSPNPNPSNANIVSVGDALFRNTPGQTFRVVK